MNETLSGWEFFTSQCGWAQMCCSWPPMTNPEEKALSPFRLQSAPKHRQKERWRETDSEEACSLTYWQTFMVNRWSCPETEYIVSKPAQFIVALLSGSLQGRQSRVSVGLSAGSVDYTSQFKEKWHIALGRMSGRGSQGSQIKTRLTFSWLNN